MNLLVTNTRTTQAYFIIRALRPYSQKIVATMYGKNRLEAGLSHAANSRLVDKRYYVPSPVEDWKAGRIQKENTEREEAYIQAVIKICEQEQIDTIFPSFDPQVYVFSKNKERFERMGVLIPIPDYETVITPLDKYRTIQAARKVEFPCPKTYLAESEEDLKRIAEELGFPLVIKPRFTSGGRGTAMVTCLSELVEKTRTVRKNQDIPMIQEFIPGKEKQQFYLTVDQKGEGKVVVCPKTHRIYLRIHRNSSAASESSVPHPYAGQATKLVREFGWWGGLTVQTKIDSRDGLPKLMEINPRLGHHLWYMTELGINAPLMCLKISRGEEVQAIEEYRVGTMLLSPVEDAVGLGFWALDRACYKFRTRLLGKKPLDPLNAPMTLKEIIQSYKRTYFNGNGKVFDPYFKYFLQDSKVSLLWWSKYCWQIITATKHLGE